MTPDQVIHLRGMKDRFDKLIEDKYRKGAIEHPAKGEDANLWDKSISALLAEAKQEVADLWSYLDTAEHGFEKIRAYISAPFRDKELKEIERNILTVEKYGRMISCVNPRLECVVVHPLIKEKWGIEKANVHGGPIDKEIIDFNLGLLRSCKVLFVCGNVISRGMEQEISISESLGMRVIYLDKAWLTDTQLIYLTK